MDLLTLIAIVIILISVPLEWYYCEKNQIQNAYNSKDFFFNLTLSFFNLTCKLAMNGLALGAVFYLSKYSLFTMDTSFWTVLGTFLLLDLLHYFFHRHHHEIRILWASHAPHHSSEYLNISTAIRALFVPRLYQFTILLPLAFLGFNPAIILIIDSLILIYGIPIHTQTVRTLGILEKVLNTPSHHRVHHGSNPKYIDKNYGAVLIVWDKLFGTFQKEEEPVVYGLAEKVESRNSFHAAFFEWISLFQDVSKARSFKEAWLLVMGKPGWKKKKENEHLATRR